MYKALYNDVVALLAHHDCVSAIDGVRFPFRRRSEHTRRVFMWTQRLLDDDYGTAIDERSLLVAALFHDVGYATAPRFAQHATDSADVFRAYATLHPPDCDVAFAEYLIAHHSDKELLQQSDTRAELLILMQADLLDESGAMAIVWDCMAKGAESAQSFGKTYEHIRAYTSAQMQQNPMATPKAMQYWADKQRLVDDFVRHFAFDLGVDVQR